VDEKFVTSVQLSRRSLKW